MSSTNHGAVDALAALLAPTSASTVAVADDAAPSASGGCHSLLSLDFSEAEFATLIGVSPRRVRELRGEGVISRSETRRYPAAQITKYCDFQRRGGGRAADSDELKAAKLRRELAAASKIEMQNLAASGRLVEVAAVKAEWGGIIRDVRAGMLAVSARVGGKLSHLGPADVAEIDAQIRNALEELADARDA